MTKILVIGSNGFIGGNLYRFLIANTSFTVYGCDIQPQGSAVNYFQVDTVNAHFDPIFKTHSFDYCINCSGAASVPASLKDPLKDYELNTVNVFKILEAIRQHQPSCKFINLSSAAVYGNPTRLPISESDILQPVSPYGIHKMQAEQICRSFHEHWQLSTCCLRIFSAYGPGLMKQLLWDLYQKSIDADAIELFGTGHETRDFIYIDDIVQALLLTIKNASFKGEVINVANGEQWSIKTIAETFYKALNWKGQLTFKGANRAGDPLNWEADISLLKRMGYSKSTDLEQGIRNYIQWLKEIK